MAIGFEGTGCINIHCAPGLTSRIVSCLPEGTDVTIDDGPYYVPDPTPSGSEFGLNHWWHVASRGWAVHRYIMESA